MFSPELYSYDVEFNYRMVLDALEQILPPKDDLLAFEARSFCFVFPADLIFPTLTSMERFMRLLQSNGKKRKVKMYGAYA